MLSLPSPGGALPVPRRLLLNEVDYDQPGYDTGEFVEIVNTGRRRYRLRRVALILVNGTTSSEYRRIQLSGPLGPSRALVVATPGVAVADGVRTMSMPLARDNLQNGAPDAIALFDTGNDVLLDAVCYEGVVDAASFDGVPGTWSLVAGTRVAELDGNVETTSLCRLPDRADTGDDDADWETCIPTPGSANSASASRPDEGVELLARAAVAVDH